MTWTHWRPEMVGMIDAANAAPAPVLCRGDLARVIPDFNLWDFWPVQEIWGDTATIADGALFMFLSAPVSADPENRHAVARIRLVHRVRDRWRDCGPLLSSCHSPGSREWSGSAILEADRQTVSLYFTGAGRRNEPALGYEQRLFQTRARLTDKGPIFTGWSEPVEIVKADGHHFMRDMNGGGAIGTIKAFRDPAYFYDPKNGREYLLFTGSLAQSRSQWNGAIGIVERVGGCWGMVEPFVSADGLNNELERPHVIVHAGLYYLFWSTQRKVFAPTGPSGPTGLYGMVADRLAGPWRPLNGSSLVIGNPPQAPHQAYSWLVLKDLSVLSFADYVGLDRAPRDAAEARRHFGGTPAPILRLALAGDRATLVA